MSHQHHKGRYHPSRTSGMQKQTRAREANKLLEETKRKKKPIDKIDPNKPDWSVKS